MQGIISARTNYIKAKATPAVVLILVGVLGVMAGFLHLFDNTQADGMHIGTLVLTANRISAIAGLILFIAGLFWLAGRRNKYAVHITTAEGEKEPVVSTKKDYVNQIVSAINEALDGNQRRERNLS